MFLQVSKQAQTYQKLSIHQELIVLYRATDSTNPLAQLMSDFCFHDYC